MNDDGVIILEAKLNCIIGCRSNRLSQRISKGAPSDPPTSQARVFMFFVVAHRGIKTLACKVGGSLADLPRCLKAV